MRNIVTTCARCAVSAHLGIARALISTFDQFDIVALGEAHQRRLDSDLRIAVIRHPDLAKKVRSIVVEFGSTTEQLTLDRYIRGENISPAQLAQVWKTTTQVATESGTHQFTRTSSLPSATLTRGCRPMRVLKEQVLQKHGKALLIYGAAHF